jgi:membrane protein implicated in regulation of membrane protease activity
MSSDISNSRGPERDLLCRGPSGFLLWCAPWLAFVVGFSVSSGLRTALWTTSFAVMGAACLLNAGRCGRVHCHFTGPFFILAAVACLAYGLGLLPLGPSGWKWIGAGTVIGALALCCIPELFLGRYRRGKDTSA